MPHAMNATMTTAPNAMTVSAIPLLRLVGTTGGGVHGGQHGGGEKHHRLGTLGRRGQQQRGRNMVASSHLLPGLAYARARATDR